MLSVLPVRSVYPCILNRVSPICFGLLKLWTNNEHIYIHVVIQELNLVFAFSLLHCVHIVLHNALIVGTGARYKGVNLVISFLYLLCKYSRFLFVIRCALVGFNFAVLRSVLMLTWS